MMFKKKNGIKLCLKGFLALVAICTYYLGGIENHPVLYKKLFKDYYELNKTRQILNNLKTKQNFDFRKEEDPEVFVFFEKVAKEYFDSKGGESFKNIKIEALSLSHNENTILGGVTAAGAAESATRINLSRLKNDQYQPFAEISISHFEEALENNKLGHPIPQIVLDIIFLISTTCSIFI